jgi:uncharacterized phage protein (TIGR02218 family)
MKTSVPALIIAHMGQETTSVGTCILITRSDNQVFGLTTFDNPVVINGASYTPGLSVKNTEITSGMAVNNLELTLLDDGSLITKIDALSGVWRNASFYMFEFNWARLADGVNPILKGVFGEIQLNVGFITIELRGLQQYLQQNIGIVTSINCRARFGDSLNANLCRLVLATYTFTGTITSITNKQILTDTGRTQADDYFGEGILTFTSGVCAGLSQKVKAYSSASQTFTLSLPMISSFGVGDTYNVSAGCRKRMAQDCITKFSNVLNFQGEPYLPGIDSLTSNA